MFARQQEFLKHIITDEILGDVDRSFTHATVLPSDNKLSIRPNYVRDFWVGYCELVSEEIPMALAERVKATSPLICDFTFIFAREDENLNEVPDKFLLMLISCIQEILQQIFTIPSAQHLSCAVVQSESQDNLHTETEIIRFRLQFAYIRIEPVVAQTIIFPQMIDIFRRKNVLSKLDAQPTNDWDKILNTNIYQAPVLMYGSIASSLDKPMNMRYITGVVDRSHVDKEEVPEQELSDVFNLQVHDDVRKGIFSPITISNDMYHWLPLFFSINYYDGVLFLKERLQMNRSNSKTFKSNEETNWDKALLFLRMIPNKQKEILHIWHDIGKVLHAESKGSEEGLDEWIRVTTELQSNSLSPRLCENKYENIAINRLTYKTLAWYARKYNPSEYSRWHRDKMNQIKEMALSGFDNDIAEALYFSDWLDYVYVTAPGKRVGGSWYRYQEPRWKKMDQAIDLSRDISEKFYKEFALMSKELAELRASTNDENVRERCGFKMAKLEKLLKKLKMSSSKRGIISEAITKFHDENFDEFIDSDSLMMGHQNCIHEVIDNHIIFREGKPEDYISRTTSVTYDFNMDNVDSSGVKMGWHHKQLKAFVKWMEQIFVDETIRHSVLNLLSSLLMGGNPDKIIAVFTGEGDNSKSALEKFIEILFGVYVFKFSPMSISGKNANGGPSPEIAQSRNSRAGLVDELEENDAMNASFLKRISGGDSFFARMLHDNGGKIEATFKILMFCNIIPRMNSFQKAIKERMIFFSCESKWIEPELAPPTEKEQYEKKLFPRNPMFSLEIPKMAAAGLWFLKERFPLYMKERVPRPTNILLASEKYWNDVDYYQIFRKDCFEEVWIVDPITGNRIRDKNSKITVEEAFREFKDWYKTYHESSRVPDLLEFKNNAFRSIGHPVDNKFWVGYRLTIKETFDVYKP